MHTTNVARVTARSALVTLLVLTAGCGRASVVDPRASPAPPTPTAAPTPAPAVVVIDPGHNGANARHTAEINRLVDAVTLRKPCDTTGTATDSGYTESAFNFDVAQRLAAVLRRSGIRVVFTRTTDDGWGPCITQRAAVGNRNRADAAVSVHADGGPRPDAGST